MKIKEDCFEVANTHIYITLQLQRKDKEGRNRQRGEPKTDERIEDMLLMPRHQKKKSDKKNAYVKRWVLNTPRKQQHTRASEILQSF